MYHDIWKRTRICGLRITHVFHPAQWEHRWYTGRIMGSTHPKERTRGRMSIPAFLGFLIATGVVVVGGAIFIGTKDAGVINVNAALQNSPGGVDENGNATDPTATIPDALKNMPNGGLVAQENQPQNTPPPEPQAPETEATTTDPVSEDGTAETTDGTTPETSTDTAE